ncbi:hypothetical protein TSUD_275730 [Trifolium subterraneum]|uniref:Lipoyl-binding domain-containing protein n=1 Tax=Trifolium subterraneum TaxID=3900 RepID=A0A2Z6M9E2_TRISU|nr:hypothetical protein TSUD_275730 [Trifolium subterraneum]
MATFSVPCPKCPSPSSLLGLKSNKILFQSGLSFKGSQSFGSLSAESASFGIQCLNKKQFPIKIQAQRNEAAIVENSNSAPNVAPPKEKENQNGSISSDTVADASSVSAFMEQVADLVKLVDSRDIVELQLKQSDCELMIRKKEALQPPPAAAIPQPSQPLYYPTLPSPPPPPPAAVSAPAASPPSKATPALPPPKTNKVKKGQVICIIEAMKLMNEIEADQTGTIAEILVDDGKPVSVGLICNCLNARNPISVCVRDLDSLRSRNHKCNAIWAVTSRSDNPHFNFASFYNSSMSTRGDLILKLKRISHVG